jgi:hypothetical protein
VIAISSLLTYTQFVFQPKGLSFFILHFSFFSFLFSLPPFSCYTYPDRRPEMQVAELIYEEVKTLPEDTAVQVLDFVGYLKEKASKKQGECPLCAKYRDPVTGELRFNAETIAAFEEGDAMLRGEIPAQRFNSLEELLADLRS